MSDIYTNTKAFQNRKKAYSESSVAGIIQAVLLDEFLIHMFDPVRLWENTKDNKLYILSGHSRQEAFKRLSREPLKDYERVIAFCKKHNISFDTLPSIVLPKSISFEDAKFIALTSNSLATHESEMERAAFYREMRTLNKLSKS